MPPLNTNDHAPHRSPALRNDPRTPRDGLIGEHALEELVSRHEPQTLTERAQHTDPYAAWLKGHEVERRAASGPAMPAPARRFHRRQPHKAPWEAIRVTLSPEGP
jgi:hypothetical protein